MTRFAVLSALPLSRESFFTAATREPLADYMRITLSGGQAQDAWTRRYSAIVDAATALVTSLRDWRVPLVQEATLADLQQATRHADVVLLFAHWCAPGSNAGPADAGLELADGTHPPSSIEQALAPAFCGTLDLCNCTSAQLAGHIKRRRGEAVSTIFNTEMLDPLPAYVIVRQLIGLCLRTGIDYRLARLHAAAQLARNP